MLGRCVVRNGEVDALPAVVDVQTAGRMLGVSRGLAYELVRTGRWPTPVLRLGRSIKIPTAPLLVLLGQPFGPPAVPASAATPQTAPRPGGHP
jgi:hypothetical protein